MLNLDPLMLVMYKAKYWKIKHNLLTNMIFVKEDSNADCTQAWVTSDLTSALQPFPWSIKSPLCTLQLPL